MATAKKGCVCLLSTGLKLLAFFQILFQVWDQISNKIRKFLLQRQDKEQYQVVPVRNKLNLCNADFIS